MTKKPKKQRTRIEQLMDERQKLQQWLDRLDAAGEDTPESVRSKVRSDYRERLDGVLRELQGHKDEMTTNLLEQQKRRDELAQDEAKQSEQLTETELRHEVGEYDEQEWTDLRTEILESLVKVREDLKAVDEEIQKLEGIIASVEGEGVGEAEVEEPEEKAEEAKEKEEAEAVAEEAAAAPVAGSQTDAFDELAFLRSVAEDEEMGPQPERASARFRAKDEPEPAEAGERLSVGASGVRPVEPEEQSPESGTARKTLKCGECGTMNLPTEWYCEKCGAELSSV